MGALQEYIDEYKLQLKKGSIQKAYRGLLKYLMDLRAYFRKKYPAYYVSGNIYCGYMDMSYFSFFPESLKKRKLKIAIVFIHQTCSFEIWLAGYNKKVQMEYWQLFKDSNWNKTLLPPLSSYITITPRYTGKQAGVQ
jgi:hypothetical protein